MPLVTFCSVLERRDRGKTVRGTTPAPLVRRGLILSYTATIGIPESPNLKALLLNARMELIMAKPVVCSKGLIVPFAAKGLM